MRKLESLRQRRALWRVLAIFTVLRPVEFDLSFEAYHLRPKRIPTWVSPAIFIAEIGIGHVVHGREHVPTLRHWRGVRRTRRALKLPTGARRDARGRGPFPFLH